MRGLGATTRLPWFCNNPMGDARLGRFWQNRAEDSTGMLAQPAPAAAAGGLIS
jgi:hypothetical protein